MKRQSILPTMYIHTYLPIVIRIVTISGAQEAEEKSREEEFQEYLEDLLL